MIPQIVRGEFMPDLISYLFGPGRHNEHVNQHLVAGYGDAVFTAPDRLWQSEPGRQRQVHDEARELGWQVEYPHARWQTEVPRGYVWHCSLSIKAEEGQLTDTQWTEAAHAMVDALGFTGTDGKAPCRWVAVRHGLSKEGNDHIHIAVNLVREDGTKANPWNDYKKASAVCAGLEERFGLQQVPGRMAGRSLPEPSRADREISAARGEPEPLRIRLERKVRASAAAARSEAHFIALARANGLLIRPRYDAGRKNHVMGYAVAERAGRTAYSNRTRTRGPVWFGGGKLASDLALPKLRQRWQADTSSTSMEALAAWSSATTITVPVPSGKAPAKLNASDACDLGAAADALAVAAASVEGEVPGLLSEAARRMARAAQDEPDPRNPAVAEAIRQMADTFLSVTFAGTSELAGTLILIQEVARLADECAARAATVTAQREARQASVLVHASAAALAEAASQQAVATLTASTRGTRMSEPAHEEELLRQLTQAGVLTAQVARAALGARTGTGASAAEIARLRAAGYDERTRHDALIRQLLGEERWVSYAADSARIVTAAVITDGERAGHDMPALLTKVINQRGWEDDPRSPSRSVAQILHYRVTKELAHPTYQRSAAAAPVQASNPSIPNDSGDSQAPSSTSPVTPEQPAEQQPDPALTTPWDGKLETLLGEERWQQYATDPRRRSVADLITKAAREGRDVDKLLTTVVTIREFETDPKSPARRVAGVLHYRIEQALAASPGATLPAEVAGVLSHATAPPGRRPKDQQARPDAPDDAPPPFRRSGQTSEGKDSR